MRHGLGAAHLLPAAGRPEIGTHDDVRVEHRHESIEVAVPRGGDKRVEQLPLRLEISVGNGSLGAHAPARPAGELARRFWGALDDGRDLGKGDGEDVVQHEREPLLGRQRLEHDE